MIRIQFGDKFGENTLFCSFDHIFNQKLDGSWIIRKKITRLFNKFSCQSVYNSDRYIIRGFKAMNISKTKETN